MRVKGNTEEARTINSYLDSLRNKIIQTELQFQYQDETVSLQEFMNVLLGKQTEKQRTLMPVFEEHNKRIYSLLHVEYSPGTYERYQTSLSHTRDFIKYRYGTEDIALSRIDHAFITDYDFYLRTERSCSNNTTVKYMKNFKKIIRICLANGWMERDPFLNYKVKIQIVEREVLTEEELQVIMEKAISVERLALVRDIFILSCYTGLAYIDVKNLTSSNIVKGIDGQFWISTHRQKLPAEPADPPHDKETQWQTAASSSDGGGVMRLSGVGEGEGAGGDLGDGLILWVSVPPKSPLKSPPK